MRLAILAALAMLMAVVVPVYAHQGDGPHTTGGQHVTSSFEDSMTIQHDLRIQAGWWGNEGYHLDDGTDTTPLADEAENVTNTANTDTNTDPEQDATESMIDEANRTLNEIIDAWNPPVAPVDLPHNGTGDVHKYDVRNTDVDETGASTASRTSGTHDPVWIWLKESDKGEPFEITLTVQGAVIGALDVWEYRASDKEGGGSITPNCPQDLVPKLYPQGDENLGSYPFRLLTETVGYHQRAFKAAPLPANPPSYDTQNNKLESTMEISLEPRNGKDGYIVAIYPLVASASPAVEERFGDARMEWNISVDDGQMTLFDDQEALQPDNPVDEDQWVEDLPTVQECALTVTDALPGGILPEELPSASTSTSAASNADLFGTALP